MTLSIHQIRPQATLLRIISALLIVFLSGCSTLKLGYNNAPSLIYWWLDGYIDLTEAQSQPVRDGLATLHTWHRSQALPAYTDTLLKIQRMAPGNVSPEQMCALGDEVRSHMTRVGERAIDALIALPPTLRPEQLKHLAQQFDKRNQKWRGEWLDVTPEDLRERRLKLAVDRAQNLYGRLETAQRTVLRNSIANSSYDPTLSHRETQRRQQDILSTLKEHSSAPARPTHIKAEALALMQRSLKSPDPSYRSQQEKLIKESCVTLANLHNSTTPAQRLKAVEVLKDYEADARVLVAQRL